MQPKRSPPSASKPGLVGKPKPVLKQPEPKTLPAKQPLAKQPPASAPLVFDEPDAVNVDPAAETVSANQEQVRTQVVRQETRVESASEHEIDSQLAHLTKRTSLEELTRAGKTHNLKTLSERNLKEWIKEALRRVISTSTTLGAAEQEQLLANTRSELTAIMAERQAEADARAAEARRLAELAAERDALQVRLTAAETQDQGRVAELERQLATAGARRDALAARVADLEAQLAGAVSRADMAHTAPIVDEEVLVSMRAALAAAREGQAAAEAERAQLQKTLSRRLIASAEVAAALLALDRRYYNGSHQHGALASSGDDAEASFFADEAAATQVVAALDRDLAAMHQRIVDSVPDVADGADGAIPADLQRLAQMDWVQVNDSIVDDLQAQLAEAQAGGTAAQQGELAELRTRLIDRDAAVAALTQERDEAQRVAQLARETVARLLREQDRAQAEKGSITNRIAASDRRQAEVDKRLADAEARAAAAIAEAADLQQASERSARLADEALRAVEAERDALRAERDAARRAAVPAASSGDLQAAQAALARARAVITDADGAPREDIGGTIVSRSPGHWQGTWRDGQGRLRSAMSTSAGWIATSHDLPGGIADEPALLVRGDQTIVAWRGDDGQARWSTLDGAGRPLGAARTLGPSVATPALSRGGGQAAPFAVTVDDQGLIHLHEADGSRSELTAALGAPPAAGAACAWHWALEGSRHVAYRDADGAIHELAQVQGRWLHANLSAKTGAPAALGAPSGYAPADHEHVVFQGVDGHVHELCFDGTRWHHTDLTDAATGAPAALGRPSGAYVAGRHTVAYRGLDGRAHVLRLRRDWRHHALAALGPIADDPTLASSGGEGALTCRSSTGQRRWLRFTDPAAATVGDLPA